MPILYVIIFIPQKSVKNQINSLNAFSKNHIPPPKGLQK
jgi:hypothetical protein